MAAIAGLDNPGFFGDRWADVYDENPERDPSPQVELLAGHVLDPAGAFVIECFVPDPARFDGGQPCQRCQLPTPGQPLAWCSGLVVVAMPGFIPSG